MMKLTSSCDTVSVSVLTKCQTLELVSFPCLVSFQVFHIYLYEHVNILNVYQISYGNIPLRHIYNYIIKLLYLVQYSKEE